MWPWGQSHRGRAEQLGLARLYGIELSRSELVKFCQRAARESGKDELRDPRPIRGLLRPTGKAILFDTFALEHPHVPPPPAYSPPVIRCGTLIEVSTPELDFLVQ
ncbi:hypothetical protein ACVNPS_09210 [Candidatus Bipolaricaulota sp. J31]